jgi:hypothetical protein
LLELANGLIANGRAPNAGWSVKMRGSADAVPACTAKPATAAAAIAVRISIVVVNS